MNDEKLKEIGGKLGVSKAEIRTLKRISLGERIMAVFEDWVVKLLIILSGAQGIALGFYVAARQPSYPATGSYEPPGGLFMPVKLFTGAVGVTGLAGAGYVVRTGGEDRKDKLLKILVTAILAILAFTIGYGFHLSFSDLLATPAYGVYSRDQEAVAP